MKIHWRYTFSSLGIMKYHGPNGLPYLKAARGFLFWRYFFISHPDFLVYFLKRLCPLYQCYHGRLKLKTSEFSVFVIMWFLTFFSNNFISDIVSLVSLFSFWYNFSTSDIAGTRLYLDVVIIWLFTKFCSCIKYFIGSSFSFGFTSNSTYEVLKPNFFNIRTILPYM